MGSAIRRASMALVVVICASLLPAVAAAQVPGGDVVERVGGTDRILTAVAASRRFFDAAEHAVIATAERYPDALAAGPLARSLDAPILLSPRDQLPDAVAEELGRLGVAQVIIVGGQDAIAQSVGNALVGMGLTVTRVAGAERFATAAAVAERLGAPDGSVAVARGRGDSTGDGFADALTSGSFGVLGEQLPTLLVERSHLPDATAAAITELAPTVARIVGGTAAVEAEVEAAVAALGPSTQRFAGATRYATAVAVARAVQDQSGPPGTVLIATGEAFPDSLVAGALTQRTAAPILLVPSTLPPGFAQEGEALEAASPELADYLRAVCASVDEVLILGLEGAISAEVEAGVADLLACRPAPNEPDPPTNPPPVDPPPVDPPPVDPPPVDPPPPPPPAPPPPPPPGPVVVPDVVGLQQGEALTRIDASDLVPTSGGSRHSATVPAGEVLEQSPVGGTDVARRSLVAITVSLGPELLVVPEVLGLDEAAARARIEVAGFVVGQVDQAESDDAHEIGEVNRQLPLAGQQALPATPVDVTLKTGSVNAPPEITSDPAVEHIVGSPYSYDVEASDDPADDLTFILQGGPLDSSGDPAATIDASTGELAWDPAIADAGLRDFAVRVEDGRGGIDTQSFTLDVRVPNRTPAARDDVHSVEIDDVLTVPADDGVLANDADPDGDDLTASLVSPPANGSVSLQADGAFVYDPAQGTGPDEIYSDIDLTRLSSAAATASAQQTAFPATRLVDGYPGSSWYVPNSSTTTGYVVTLAFPTAVAPDTLTLLGNRDQFAEDGFGVTQVAVQLLDGGGDLVLGLPVVDFPAGTAGDGADRDATVDLAAANGGAAPEGIRTVTITITGTEGRYPGLGEVVVLGDGPITELGPEIEWSFTQRGVYNGTTSVADLDRDGFPEVIFNDVAGIIHVVDGRDGTERWQQGGHPTWAVTPVVADVHPHPGVEVMLNRGSTVYVYAAEGQDPVTPGDPRQGLVLGQRATVAVSESQLSVADVDGDGTPEILAPGSSRVAALSFNTDGALIEEWRTPANGCGINGGYRSCTPVASDIDLDGVVEIVAGRTIYDGRDGTLITQNAAVSDGWVATGQFDDDPQAEIVLVSSGRVHLLNHDLTPVWATPFTIPEGGRGGHPTVGDFDADGRPEIGVAGARRYVVVNDDGTQLWQAVTVDGSSNATGSTIFDFDNDGSPEVVYRDEQHLWIYDGPTGAVRVQEPMRSGTTVEAPVVADVDADGHAEIVAISDVRATLPDGTFRQPGLYVFGGSGGNWVRARQIWNQQSYHVTNVNADGTIPRVEQPNWLTAGLNNFRENDFLPDEETRLDSFTYRASDGTTSDQATVFVDVLPPENDPRFTCEPNPVAVVGFPYTSRICATDPDPGDTITFSIAGGPADLRLEGPSGVLTWTPTQGDLGTTTPQFAAVDSTARRATAVFAITVVPAVEVPDVVGDQQSAAETAVGDAGLRVGAVTERHDREVPVSAVIEQTPPGGPVARPDDRVDLVVSLGPAPGDEDLDGDRVSPNDGDCDDRDAAIFTGAADPDGDGIDQNCDGADGVLVLDRVEITPPDATIRIGERFQLTGTAVFSDGSRQDITALGQWVAGGDAVTVDALGRVTGAAAGTADVELTYDGRTASTTVTVRVPAPADRTPPTIAITQPAGGATVNAVTEVRGTATDANFAAYSLDLLDSSGAVVGDPLGGGTDAVEDGPLGTLDPTGLDGLHTLRLTATDLSGNSSRGELLIRIGAPPGPTLERILLNPGNPQLLVGDTLATDATAYYTDGSSADLNPAGTAAWATEDDTVFTVSDTGVITGVDAGTAMITLEFQGAVTTGTVTVLTPGSADQTPPTIAITQPADGAAVTVPTDVTGTATDTNFAQYSLVLVDSGGSVVDPPLGGGTAPVDNDVLGRLDPAQWAAGVYTLRLTVTDVAGNSIQGQRWIRIGPAPGPTLDGILLNPVNPQVLVGDTLAMEATAYYTDGSSVPVTSNGTWTTDDDTVFTVSGTGVITGVGAGNATVTVTFDGGQASRPVLVVAPVAAADRTPPTALLTAPDAGTEVTAPVAVVGTATDAELLRWRLDLVDGDELVAELAADTVAVTEGTLTTLDPTMLINGSYELLLTVVDVSGNESTARQPVTIDGQLKVGTFSLSFTDLVVPVAGIPLEVSRNYDTRDDTLGDFGYGWQLGLTDVRVTSNGIQGLGWAVTGRGFSYRLQPTRPHTITIVLPDGSTEQFEATTNPSATAFVPPTAAVVRYVPLPGTRGRLDVLGNTNVIVFGGAGQDAELVDDTTFDPFDPQGFRYTAGDGTVFVLDADGTVHRITDPNGNTITIGPDGITHSGGQSVTFERDAVNRITAIEDPDGNRQTYSYSAAGDLVAHTDAEGNTTRYRYTGAHDLVEILDPLGRVVDRREYDAQGRLVAVTDAAGNRTTLNHNLTGRSETVTDALGNAILFEYDANGNVTRVVDPLGGEITHTYDADGNQASSTDPLGRTTTRQFDARGNLLSEALPGGATTTFTYDAAGRQTSVTDPLGRITRSTYDSRGNLLRTDDPGGGAVTRTYDALGTLRTITDPSGAVTAYETGARGLITAETDALGRRRTIAYDAVGNPTTVTDAAGDVTMLEVDGRGMPTRITDPSGASFGVAFDTSGGISRVTDPLGRTVEVARDAAGNETTSRLPDGSSWTFGYDVLGRRVTTTGPDSTTTRFEYDALDRQTAQVAPDGTTLRTTYDAAGQVIAETDARGGVTGHTYDLLGRVTSTTDALGGTTTFAYDAAGNLVSESDPTGAATTYTYDALDRVVATTNPDGTVVRHGYDAAGNEVERIEPRGTTTFTYDAAGQLVSIVDSGGGTTTVVHDVRGNRTSVTDANGHTTRYAYDAAARLVETTYPSGVTERATYDLAGNPVAVVDRNGLTTNRTYDAAGRVSRETLPDGSETTWTYDAAGRPTTATDATGTTSYVHDVLGRLTSLANPDGSRLEYEYDAAGNRTAMRAAIGVGAAVIETTYVYDAAGRMVEISDPQGDTATFGHDAAGRTTAVARPNGTTTATTYDAMGRATGIEHRRGGDVLDALTYQRDAAGDPTAIAYADGTTSAYAYDALRQVVGEMHRAGDGSTRFGRDYTYDAVANRLTETEPAGPTRTFVYDVDDRLLAAGAETYTYDAAGRQLTRTDAAGTLLLGYDPRGLLTSAVPPTSVPVVYRSDPLGSRVAADGTARLVDPLAPSGVPEVVLEHRDGQVLATYVVGPDGVLSETHAGATAWLHADEAGSTRLVTDDAGAVVGTATWTAFGQPLDDGLPAAIRHRFAGERAEPATGLYHLRAREYDPGTGRFTTVDPDEGSVAQPRSRHPYLYAEANPLSYGDPTGRFSVSLTEISIVNAIASGISAALFAPPAADAWERAQRAVVAAGLAALATLAILGLTIAAVSAIVAGVVGTATGLGGIALTILGAAAAVPVGLVIFIGLSVFFGILSACLGAAGFEGRLCNLREVAIASALTAATTLGSLASAGIANAIARNVVAFILNSLPPFAQDYLNVKAGEAGY